MFTLRKNMWNGLMYLRLLIASLKIRAAVKVNSEKLLWNWQLGRDLVQRKAEERWGDGNC